jgi:exosortase H (IPTLxxWG-CTERM-specific)
VTTPGGSREPLDRPEADASRRPRLLRDPWFRFAVLFSVLAIGCEVLYYAVLVDGELLQGYLKGLAWVSGWILRALLVEVDVSQAVVTSGGFSVRIAHGCDAIQICALLSVAVLSFPAPLARKLWGLAIGILWLQLLNQMRIVTLVLIGRDHHSWFETAHYKLWPSFLIAITVVTWIAWVRWATRDVAQLVDRQA